MLLNAKRQALGLWRGAPLADMTYESFARSSIERLEEMRVAALELRIDADLALGRRADCWRNGCGSRSAL